MDCMDCNQIQTDETDVLLQQLAEFINGVGQLLKHFFVYLYKRINHCDETKM